MDPKKEEMDPKRTQKMRKPIDQQTENLKLFLKTEFRPKKWGNGPKKKETDHQSENSKLFLKTGNVPIKRGNGPKKGETDQQTYWEFKTFSENRKRTKKWENGSKILGNPSKI